MWKLHLLIETNTEILPSHKRGIDMLDFIFDRRNFLRIGSIGAGMSAIGLSDIGLAAKSAQEGFDAYKDKTVVWVWLGGGPTQFETFHAPLDDVPSEWKPVNGNIYDSKTNISLGADWQELSKHTTKLNVVNSFSHKDSSHRQGTHFMMTGHYNSERSTTSTAKYPSFGSIVSSLYGANNPNNGVPTYVKQGKIEGDEGAWLGGAYKPFDPSNKDNLTPRIELDRFSTRKQLLAGLDAASVSGKGAESVQFYKGQAYDVILGSAKNAFAVEKESDATKALYGSTKANDIGEQLILARRLAENGTRFITLHYGGWDMHSNISKAMKGKVPPLDKALAGFLQDLQDRGLSDKVLLVVTGEFGRTKFNTNSGRDHWPSITPMLMAGGEYQSGRTIGVADRSYSPIENPVGPLDLQATLFNHFGIDENIQKTDNGGRPRYLLEGEAKVIL
jgi:hypothetical protein|tara:strand:+ start:4239 stop:5576 length:1338 start_codon:yes stop_codon:yes gene_type:complete